MDEKERQKLTVLVTAEEAESIKASAAKLGISVSEYIRNRTLARASDPPAGSFEALLRHLIFILTRLHVSVFAIAEAASTLSTEQLERVYDDALDEGLRYLAELPQHLAKAQQRLAAQTNTAPPAAEKGVV